jgi:hypothetical protein
MKNYILAAIILLGVSVFSLADTKKTILMGGQLEADFSSWGNPALSGGWEIVREEGKTYLDLSKDFQAKEGPDVKIFLSRVTADKITGKNASNEAVFVKLLEDFKGPGRIELPNSIDITKFKSIIFYCEQYSKLWGTSSLSTTNK